MEFLKGVYQLIRIIVVFGFELLFRPRGGQTGGYARLIQPRKDKR